MSSTDCRFARGPILAALLATIPIHAGHTGPATVPAGFSDTRLAGSLDQPVGLAIVPDPNPVTPRILFVEQRTARVRMLRGSAVTTVGTVPTVELAGLERGLLGVAVDPRFPAAPYVYVHATDSRAGGHVVISRFTLTGDLGYTGSGSLSFDSASRYDLLDDLPDDGAFHNGGTVRFGPDQRLYASVGDDGATCAAPVVTEPVGKILRLDVSRLPSGPGGPAPYALLTAPGNPYATHADSSARLVWTSGLRNPFRFHIDALTGDLHVADVGENEWEELTRFGAGGGNGGWPWYEGPDPFTNCGGSAPASIAPIAFYSHSEGAAIVSAGIYRGASAAGAFPPEYEGDSFYIDYYAGFMRRLTGGGSNWSAAPPVEGQPTPADWASGMSAVADVAIAPDGSLIYVRQSENFAQQTGEIRRIAYVQTAAAAIAVPATLAFAPPRPAPARGPVVLSWSQPADAEVDLVIFDVAGRALRTLADGDRLAAGTHERTWDGTDARGAASPPGLYFARLAAGGETRSVRITRVR